MVLLSKDDYAAYCRDNEASNVKIKGEFKQIMDRQVAQLKNKKNELILTLDKVLADIDELESQSTNSVIDRLNQISMRREELEKTREYLLSLIHINQLLMMVEEESANLSTVGMAIDGFEQLTVICNNLKHANLKAKLAVKLEDLSKKFAVDFEVWLKEVIDRTKWPSKTTSEEDTELLLLTCQSYRLFEVITGHNSSASTMEESKCIDQLTLPLAAQFHFHFSCDRPTNRLDKPEWALDYLIGLAKDHGPFFATLDELLDSNCQILFIKKLVTMAKERLATQKKLIMDNGLLPHVISSVIDFSTDLESLSGYKEAGSEIIELFLGDSDDMAKWLVFEKNKLLDEYEAAFDGLVDYSTIEPIVNFLSNHFGYLRNLNNAAFQTELLLHVTIPVLESLLHRLEFDVPAFVNKPNEAVMAMHLYSACFELKTLIGVDWGEDVCMIELSQTSQCHSAFGYDPSGKVGTVFWRVIEALQSIQANIHSKLSSFLRDAVFAHLARWSAAMHYSREGPLAMHDSLRQALLEMGPRAALLKEHLHSEHHHVFVEIFVKFTRDLHDWLYSKMILRNYFSELGSGAFSRDLEVIEFTVRTILDSAQICITSGKIKDAVVLLRLKEDDGVQCASVLKRLLENDKLSEATKLLGRLGIEHLTLAECEQVLASRK